MGLGLGVWLLGGGRARGGAVGWGLGLGVGLMDEGRTRGVAVGWG